jgi:hypothetical protein
MKELLLNDKLIELEVRIDHQRSPRLRADSLLNLLKIHQAILKKSALLRIAKQELNENPAETDIVQLLSEINMAVMILAHYIEKDDFSLTAGSVGITDKDDVDRFEMLDVRLIEVVAKFNDDYTQFLEETVADKA